jgi:hypothetical protein
MPETAGKNVTATKHGIQAVTSNRNHGELSFFVWLSP